MHYSFSENHKFSNTSERGRINQKCMFCAFLFVLSVEVLFSPHCVFTSINTVEIVWHFDFNDFFLMWNQTFEVKLVIALIKIRTGPNTDILLFLRPKSINGDESISMNRVNDISSVKAHSVMNILKSILFLYIPSQDVNVLLK